jgi:hypothetical protein
MKKKFYVDEATGQLISVHLIAHNPETGDSLYVPGFIDPHTGCKIAADSSRMPPRATEAAAQLDLDKVAKERRWPEQLQLFPERAETVSRVSARQFIAMFGC